jgi:hypothetical protein
MSPPKVIETNYGLASNYGDFIEVHYLLSGEIRDSIMKHERRHSSDRHYTKEDMKNDFQSENPYFFKSLKFCFFHPEAFIGFFPLMYSYYAKDWSFNWTAVIPFTIIGLFFSLFATLLFHVNIFSAFIGYSIMFVILNALMLIYTHIRVKKQKDFQYREVS